MTRLATWSPLALALLLAAGCGGGAIGGTGGDGQPADAAGDGGPIFADGARDGSGCASGVVCGGTCCKVGESCEGSTCVPAKTCSNDEECDNDTYCDNGKCIPFGTGPKGPFDQNCTQLVPIGLFSPAEQCRWSGPPAGDANPNHKNVLGTPAVADFNLDGDPSTRKPSIVFVSYDGQDGGGPASQCDGGFFGVIRVIDGATCAQQHSLTMAKVRPASPVAIGDLDGDGRPEIVAPRCGGGLAAFTYDATTKAFKLLWTSNPNNLFPTGGGWAGPAIHDLDDDGKPEVLHWGTVWSNTGQIIDQSLGQLAYGSGSFPVVADIDGDGKIELVNGAGVWRFTGGKWTVVHANTGTNGHVAIADFGTFGTDPTKDDRSKLDGVAEIAVVRSGTIRVQTAAGRVVFGPINLPGGGGGGPPTIGDFDKDGRAEVAAAGSDSYTVFDPDCVGTPVKANCDSMTTTGILWSKVSQDHSSNVTGSSVFDFDGDGQAEAVYADECFNRVYDGRNGTVLFSQWRTSCTWNENPIVADVDGDFNSELVIPSNTNCNISCAALDPAFGGLRCGKDTDCPGGKCDSGLCRCTTDPECGGNGFVCAAPLAGSPGSGNVCRAKHGGKTAGVLVYRDILDRWVSSRMIWNQHTYSVTNVADDGTIPKTSAWVQNWNKPGLNNYRQNVQGGLKPNASPDATAKRVTTELPCTSEFHLTLKIEVCNRGTQPMAAGLPVTFYKGKPTDQQPICTGTTKTQIDPGKCEEVTCVWKGAPTNESVDVWAVADDSGAGQGTSSECKEGNNATKIPGVRCGQID
jgi:hypothetical protein